MIAPVEGTFYAGAIGTLTLAGGRAPYALNSSEPTVLPVPAVFNGHTLDVVPNNPGTIDTGLPPGSVPIRTVNILARDQLGVTATAKIHVAQNFLTGYQVFFITTCPSGANACAGGDTAITFDAVTNGVLYGLRQFKVDVVRGPCLLANPAISGALRYGTSVTSATDHEGKLSVVLNCPAGIASQIGALRLTDVATGASTDFLFTISEASATQNLTVIPNSLDFVGPDTTHCGTGTADVYVFDGLPPYSAVSSNSAVLITSVDTPVADFTRPAISRSQPGRFTITVTNPFQCVDTTVVITDARGGRVTLAVKSETGSGTPPPSAMSVIPNSITLACGGKGSVLVIGGAGTYSVATTDQNLTTAISGNTLTLGRNGSGVAPAPGTPNVASTVNVTDGTFVVPVSVISPQTCP